jgi:hypothetical protein
MCFPARSSNGTVRRTKVKVACAQEVSQSGSSIFEDTAIMVPWDARKLSSADTSLPVLCQAPSCSCDDKFRPAEKFPSHFTTTSPSRLLSESRCSCLHTVKRHVVKEVVSFKSGGGMVLANKGASTRSLSQTFQQLDCMVLEPKRKPEGRVPIPLYPNIKPTIAMSSQKSNVGRIAGRFEPQTF